MAHRLILFIILSTGILHGLPCFGNSNDLKNSEKTDSAKVASHILILNEEEQVTVNGAKASMISITFSKKLKVQILDSLGADLYKSFEVPQLSDPYVPSQAPEINNIQPQLKAVDLLDFKYMVNGKEMKKPEFDGEEITRVRFNQFEYTTVLTCQLQELEPGAIVDIEYTVRIPYPANWDTFLGYRFFFHGPYPKKKYSFKLNIPKKLIHEIHAVNNATFTKSIEEEFSVINVSMEDIPGCTSEPGARLYLQLPYLSFIPKPFSWLYFPFSPTESKFMPFHICLARFRESQAKFILNKFSQGVNDPNMNAVRKFIEIHRGSDYTNGGAFISAHHDIVKNFEFLDDSDVLSVYDNRKPRLGQHLLSKQLRNVGRFDTYRYLLGGLGLPYNTIYVCDVRYGMVGSRYIAPMFSNDYLFLTQNGSQNVLIYPKKSNLGYFANELPFYLEGANGIRIALDDLFLSRIEDYNPSIDYTRTPKIPAAKNTRTIYGQINMSETGSETIRSKVSLSGHFSTNSRHWYLGKGCDHTINPTYCEGPAGQLSSFNNTTINITTYNEESPFEFRCTNSYDSELISSNGDGAYISLQGLFPHVIDQERITEPRHLAYFPDFRFSDIIHFSVKLNDDYQLDKPIIIELDNAYGHFEFKAEQSDARTVSISSAFTVKAEYVAPTEISNVIEIHDAIRSVGNSKLTLSRKK